MINKEVTLGSLHPEQRKHYKFSFPFHFSKEKFNPPSNSEQMGRCGSYTTDTTEQWKEATSPKDLILHSDWLG